MPVYFFNIRRRGQIIEDEEGVELADLDAARNEAIASVRDLAADELRSESAVDTSDGIDVVDSDGHVLLAVTVAQAIADGA